MLWCFGQLNRAHILMHTRKTSFVCWTRKQHLFPTRHAVLHLLLNFFFHKHIYLPEELAIGSDLCICLNTVLPFSSVLQNKSSNIIFTIVYILDSIYKKVFLHKPHGIEWMLPKKHCKPPSLESQVKQNVAF